MYLAYFKSKGLPELSPFGRFWHLFPLNPDFIVNQDDENYTSHWSFDALDTDVTKIDSNEVVYKVFGCAREPY
jgi:hypothetical protein